MTEAGDTRGGVGRRLAIRFAAPMALFLAALAVRALPARTVLLDDGIQPFGGDAFYHLRRIAFSMAHFPETLDVDPYLNFPFGARAIWTPVFDWVIALVALGAGAQPASAAMERIAVWVPPVLGAATVVALYTVALEHFGARVAVWAGALLCLLSGHFWYSQIGFVDHHCAVALMTTLLLGAAMEFLGCAVRAPTGVWSWLLGIALGGALAVWPGALLHVGIAELALVGFLLTRERPEDARRAAVAFATVQLAALVVVAPLGWQSEWPQWGRWSPVVSSRFQPWLFAALGVFGVLCRVAWGRSAAAAQRRRRLVSGALLGVLVLGASVASIPELGAGGADAWRWFARDERFQSLVSESQPLFVLRGALTTSIASARLSWFVFLSPVALAAAVAAWARAPAPAPRLFFAGWTAALLLATLFQKRFFNSASVALALLMACALAACHGWLLERLRGVRGGRPLAAAATVAAAALLMAPVLASYRGYVENWRRPAGIPIVSQTLLELNVAISTARSIRLSTPPTDGWLEPDAAPEYGILGPWTLGHVLEYVARRPTVTTGFGDDIGEENFQRAARYYLGEEAEAAAIADALAVRYVIAQRGTAFLGEAPGPRSVFSALFARDGNGAARDGNGASSPAGAAALPALQRHRLVYESWPLGGRDPEQESQFKLFEVVTGAAVTGLATPGRTVVAEVGLHTNRSRSIRYEASARVGADGRYAFRLPYANRDQPGVVKVDAYYVLRCDGSTARLVLDESQVQDGAAVAGPALECGAANSAESAGSAGSRDGALHVRERRVGTGSSQPSPGPM